MGMDVTKCKKRETVRMMYESRLNNLAMRATKMKEKENGRRKPIKSLIQVKKYQEVVEQCYRKKNYGRMYWNMRNRVSLVYRMYWYK